MGQLELVIDLEALHDLVPAIDAKLAIGHIIVAQPFIDREQRIFLHHPDLIAVKFGDLIGNAL